MTKHRTTNQILTLLLAFLPWLQPATTQAKETPSPDVSQHQQLYRDFLQLYNYGSEEAFQAHADRYLQFLTDSGYTTEYYKIKTNVGFFLVNHEHPLRAMRLALEIESEISNTADTTLMYLVNGLKGDVYRNAHNIIKADSIYRLALRQVGSRDPKFTLLVHTKLTEVNLAVSPEEALGWADTALVESEKLNSIDYRSMAMAIKCYLYFMLGMRDEFNDQLLQYNNLKAEFQRREEAGEDLRFQRFNYSYDNVLDVARMAFDGLFAEAASLADTRPLNVDRQMVRFRINGLEGEYEKERAHKKLVLGFTIMTALYIFVYLMGRRRLLRKISQRSRELKIALKQADAANRMKSSFIRSMSHEIRTPLNAITGFSQILCTPGFELSDQEREDMKKRITSSSEAITIIINELLELAAGESVTLDRDSLLPVNVNELCSIATARAQKHNKKGLELTFTTDLADDFAVPTNAETLMQILSKVIDNALKFTEEGSVTVHATRTPIQVEISVTDTGVGIPADRQKDIFDNFVKLDDYTEGVGLGLPICRRLVKMLGGDIQVDPTHTEGARFLILLPLK